MVQASDVLAKGKTKVIYTWPEDPKLVRVYNKDDLTAGDGAKRDAFDSKAAYATETTCNVFKLLERHGIMTAFVRQLCRDEFLARNCAMLPYEVVTRRLAWGSYLKRHAEAKQGDRFDPLRTEFYLKTEHRNFKGIDLEKDDPLIVERNEGGALVARPDQPVEGQALTFVPAEKLGWRDADHSLFAFRSMEHQAQRVFAIIEQAWAVQGKTLVDMKIEFGYWEEDTILVADVIDNDSWRVLTASGEHLDKQLYRDGVELETVARRYAEVADLTKRFLESV